MPAVLGLIRKKASCGCFGGQSHKPATAATLARSLTFTAVAFVVVTGEVIGGRPAYVFAPGSVVAALVFLAVTATVTHRTGQRSLARLGVDTGAADDDEARRAESPSHAHATDAPGRSRRDFLRRSALVVGGATGLATLPTRAWAGVRGSAEHADSTFSVVERSAGRVLLRAPEGWTLELRQTARIATVRSSGAPFGDVVSRAVARGGVVFATGGVRGEKPTTHVELRPGQVTIVRVAGQEPVIKPAESGNCGLCKGAAYAWCGAATATAAACCAGSFGVLCVFCAAGAGAGCAALVDGCGTYMCGPDPLKPYTDALNQAECLAACEAACGGPGTCSCCPTDRTCYFPHAPTTIGQCRCACL